MNLDSRAIMIVLRLTAGAPQKALLMPCYTVNRPALSACGESQQPPRLNRAGFVVGVAMNTGIYKIVNTVTGAVYVGSAALSFRRRWQKHLSYLRRGKHVNPHLQSAWNKYGETAFEFIILEATAPDGLLALEQWYIDNHARGLGVESYNVAPVAGSMLGFKFSEESKARVGAFWKGRKKTAEHLAKMCKNTYNFVSPDGVRYEGITNLVEFCAEHGLNIHSMRGVWSGRLPSCKRWTRDGGYVVRRFSFVAPNGVVCRDIENLTEFCRQHGLDFSCMARVHRGENKQHHGWRRYEEQS